MLKHFLRINRYNSGYHTNYLTKKMNSFKPTSQQQIIQTLKQIEPHKEYIEHSPSSQSFVTRVEQYLLRKSGISTKSLYIYQYLKQMGFMSLRFKYGMYKKLCKEMNKIGEDGINIKNNQLEVLLWFLYREYPFMRDNKFQQIASDSSLRLFDIHEYMTKQKSLPKWQPYIRLTTMLQSLGHTPQTRYNLTLPQLKKTDYLYYPYLPNLFPSNQQLIDYRTKNQITQPFLIHLCNQYLARDKIKYDTYMQHVEKIDNQETREQIEKVVDVLHWQQYCQLLELYGKAVEGVDGEIDSGLGYEVNQLFWRLCQSGNVNIQSGIRILQIFSTNPKIYNQNISKLLPRTKDSLLSQDSQTYRFLPSQAFISGFKSALNLKSFDIEPLIQNQIIEHLSKQIPQIKIWEDGDKQKLKDIFEKEKIQVGKQVKSYLELAY